MFLFVGSWRVSFAWTMARYNVSVGCKAADVHKIIFSNTLVLKLGIATIVAIEGGPDHIPLLFGVISALKSAGNCTIVHLVHEGFELIEVYDAVSVAVDLIPRIIDLLLENYSVSGAAFLFVGDAQRCLERLLGLLLGISEGGLPFLDVDLKRCE